MQKFTKKLLSGVLAVSFALTTFMSPLMTSTYAAPVVGNVNPGSETALVASNNNEVQALAAAWLDPTAETRQVFEIANPSGTALASMPVKVAVEGATEGIRFFQGEENLAYEVMSYDPDGTSTYYVLVPEIAAQGTSITAYYGTEGIAQGTDVWQEYEMVQHMNEAEITLGLDDTGNQAFRLNQLKAYPVKYEETEYGQATLFDGRQRLLYDAAVGAGFQELVLSAVVDVVLTEPYMIAKPMIASGIDPWTAEGGGTYFLGTKDQKYFLRMHDNTQIDTGVVADAGVHLVTMNYTGAEIELYVDGERKFSQPLAIGAIPPSSAPNMAVAGYANKNVIQNGFKGTLHEVRIASTKTTPAQEQFIYANYFGNVITALPVEKREREDAIELRVASPVEGATVTTGELQVTGIVAPDAAISYTLNGGATQQCGQSGSFGLFVCAMTLSTVGPLAIAVTAISLTDATNTTTQNVNVTVAMPEPEKITKVTVTFNGDTTTQKGFTWYTSKVSEGTVVEVVENTGVPADFSQATAFSGAPEDTYISRNSKEERVHKAIATGLKPATKYYFRVGDPALDLWSEGEFATASTEGGFTFIDLSDTQDGGAKDREGAYDISAQTIRKAYETAPEAEWFSINGDLTEMGNRESDWDYLLGKASDILKKTTIAPSSGNHDATQYAFYDHFNVDEAADSPTTTGSYYSFDYQNAHFVMLNSNETNSDPYANFSQEQADWMERDINAARERGQEWIIVGFHKGPYTTANHYSDSDIKKSRQNFGQLISELGVDLVMQGHDHIYARTKSLLQGDGELLASAEENVQTVTEKWNGLDVEYDINPLGTTWVIPNTAGVKDYGLNSKLKDGSEEAKTYLNLFDRAEQQHEKTLGVDVQNFMSINIDGNKLTAVTYEIANYGEPYVVDQFGIIKQDETEEPAAPAFITNIEPAENLERNVGETLVVEFDATPGLTGTFSLRAPLTNVKGEPVDNVKPGVGEVISEWDVWEEEEGHYVGYYNIPKASMLTVAGAAIEVRVVDAQGNGASAVAQGRVWINTPYDGAEPVLPEDPGLIIGDYYDITNLVPSAERYLETGDVVQVAFDSAPGLTAYYTLQTPLAVQSSGGNITKQRMREVSPGHYSATFIVPGNISFTGAQFKVYVVDSERYASVAVADGKLNINVDYPGQGYAPVAPPVEVNPGVPAPGKPGKKPGFGVKK